MWALRALRSSYFPLVLASFCLLLMMFGVFRSFNVYSGVFGLLVCVTLAERLPSIPGRGPKVSLLEKVAVSFLIAVGFEILFSTVGRAFFPLIYAVLPAVCYYMGWQAATAAILATAVLDVTLNPLNLGTLLRLLPLPVSAFIPPWAIANSGRLRQFLNGFVYRALGMNEEDAGGASVAKAPTDAHVPTAGSKIQVSYGAGEDEGLRGCLGSLVDSFNLHTALVYLENPEGLMEIADWATRGGAPIDVGQKVHFRSGYLGWVARTRTLLNVGCVKNPDNLVYYRRSQPGVKSVLIVPIVERVEGRLLGMLVLDSLLEEAFGEKETKIAQFVADLVLKGAMSARAVRDASLSTKAFATFYEFSRKLTETLDLDATLDCVVDTVAQAMETEAVAITLADPKGGGSTLSRTGRARREDVEGRLIPHGDTLVGLVAETGKSFYAPDLTARQRFRAVFGRELDFALGVSKQRTLLIMPLRRGASFPGGESHTFGCLVILKPERDALGTEQKRLAEVVSRDAGCAIYNAMLYAEARELAITDGLTGLYNLRHFQAEFERTIETYGKFSGKVSLMLCDIDRFKHLNDTFGHQTGDTAIAAVADSIAKAVGKRDVPARYGGDEFAVLMPDANERRAKDVAEKICSNVKQTPWDRLGIETPVTVSIGIATFPEDAFTKDALIKHADRALYKAKHLGRNKVVHFQDIEDA
jgi:diguanylate cyclase (GGDEF)-like protein